LSAAIPGQTFYSSNELPKIFYSLDTDSKGRLSNLKEIQPRGEYSYVVDKDGNIYVTDGQIFVYDKTGKEIKRINVAERPVSMVIGGKEGNTLFITTNTSLYSMKIN